MNLTVLDSDNEIHHIAYVRLEYPSLMELISNTYYTEIGECKARGLCGTCIIEALAGYKEEAIGTQEKHTLEVNNAIEKKYRLACQILLDDKINGAFFKEIGTL